MITLIDTHNDTWAQRRVTFPSIPSSRSLQSPTHARRTCIDNLITNKKNTTFHSPNSFLLFFFHAWYSLQHVIYYMSISFSYVCPCVCIGINYKSMTYLQWVQIWNYFCILFSFFLLFLSKFHIHRIIASSQRVFAFVCLIVRIEFSAYAPLALRTLTIKLMRTCTKWWHCP